MARVAKPLALVPSGFFDGNDGWWSSFMVEVGTPPQTVELLPGTSALAGNTVWVIINEGCWEAIPGLAGCASSRGGVFTRNQSTTWSTQNLANGGLFDLETIEEGSLGLTGAAQYGFDTLGFGLLGQGLPTINGTLIAGVATVNSWLGSLGMSPWSVNISSLNEPMLSLLGRLVNESVVPSHSWAYTAGASYYDPQVVGSATFGGYDSSRMDLDHVLAGIPFNADLNRDLVVELKSITDSTIGSAPLQAESISVFIDSMVTELWLPAATCTNFEQAFNLTWNANKTLYLISEEVHDALVAQNPTFTFTIGADGGGETVDIAIPYAAFDLNVTVPIVENESRYFPLKRAANSTEYTLGRVFLQEAYIIADYDRQNFTIAQALHPTAATTQKLVPICAPGKDEACRLHGVQSLGKGDIVGVVIGVVVGFCLSAVCLKLLFRLRKRRRTQQQAMKPSESGSEICEKHGEAIVVRELDSEDAAKHELVDRGVDQHELSVGNSRFINDSHIAELMGQTQHQHGAVTELPTSDVAAYELDASGNVLSRSQAPKHTAEAYAIGMMSTAPSAANAHAGRDKSTGQDWPEKREGS